MGTGTNADGSRYNPNNILVASSASKDSLLSSSETQRASDLENPGYRGLSSAWNSWQEVT